MAFFMLGVAFSVDFLQWIVGLLVFIPVLGFILVVVLGVFISVFAWMIFYFWFKLLGVGFFDNGGRKLVIWVSGGLAELTFLGVLPIWTFTIARTIAAVRVEDKV